MSSTYLIVYAVRDEDTSEITTFAYGFGTTPEAAFEAFVAEFTDGETDEDERDARAYAHEIVEGLSTNGRFQDDPNESYTLLVL